MCAVIRNLGTCAGVPIFCITRKKNDALFLTAVAGQSLSPSAHIVSPGCQKSRNGTLGVYYRNSQHGLDMSCRHDRIGSRKEAE